MKSFDLKKQIARMGRNRLVPILAALLWTGSFAFAQNVVRGTVTDENGEPLPGVSVVVKEGGKAVTGVMTDMSGQYSLSVPAGAELEFSFVGFQTQTFPAGQVPGSLTLATDILQESVVIGYGTRFEVQMTESQNFLDEAVAIGYGTVKKKDVLGSISTVREQDLVNRKTGNVVESMQGMTSGVKITSSGQPGSGSAIQIRGIGSFTGNSPLFIVDGSYGGSELGLNVDDIESIQVLKDASSAAIYGSRAASGVVIITTKKGKAGPLKVTGDASAQLYWLPRYDLMDAETYKLYDDRAYEEAMLQGVAGVTKTQNHFDGDTDWQSEMLRTGLLQNYNVALSGGNNDIRYYVSANHKRDAGALRYTGYEQTGFRINTSGRKGIFEFGENFFFTKSNTQKLNTATGWIWSNFIAMPPTIPAYPFSPGPMKRVPRS